MEQIVNGAHVFTGQRSAPRLAFHRMASSLRSPENRARFQADEAGYMRDMGCSEDEIALVAARDWQGMMAQGASIYLMLKIGAAVGHTLPQIGAHTRGGH